MIQVVQLYTVYRYIVYCYTTCTIVPVPHTCNYHYHISLHITSRGAPEFYYIYNYFFFVSFSTVAVYLFYLCLGAAAPLCRLNLFAFLLSCCVSSCSSLRSLTTLVAILNRLRQFHALRKCTLTCAGSWFVARKSMNGRGRCCCCCGCSCCWDTVPPPLRDQHRRFKKIIQIFKNFNSITLASFIYCF